MPPEFMQQLPSLGISGLLFVMWWFERQERTRASMGMQEALKQTALIVEMNDRLLAVVQGNTEAVTALREELRSHRAAEAEWMGRVTQQLARLEHQQGRSAEPAKGDLR